MNYDIPPGARHAASRKAQWSPWLEKARFDEPERLVDRINREKKIEEQRAKIVAAFHEADLDKDGEITWDELRTFMGDRVSLLAANDLSLGHDGRGFDV